MMFRLALALGKTVREIEHGMDSHELTEWIAYTNIEPLPDPWQIGALQCAIMANCWSSGKKKYTPQDFMPQGKAPKRQCVGDQLRALRAIAVRHNSKMEQGGTSL